MHLNWSNLQNAKQICIKYHCNYEQKVNSDGQQKTTSPLKKTATYVVIIPGPWFGTITDILVFIKW